MFRYSKWFVDGYDVQQFRALEQLEGSAEARDRSLHALSKSHGQVRDQVELLGAAVTVLIRKLATVGGLDTEALVAEIETEMEQTRAARDAAATTPRTTLACFRCRREVPAARTVMTGDGPCCDPSCAP